MKRKIIKPIVSLSMAIVAFSWCWLEYGWQLALILFLLQWSINIEITL